MLMDLMLVYDKFYRTLPGKLRAILTLCMLGNVADIFCHLLSCFKTYPFKFIFKNKIIQLYFQSVK